MKFNDFSKLALNSRPAQEPCLDHNLFPCLPGSTSLSGSLNLQSNTFFTPSIYMTINEGSFIQLAVTFPSVFVQPYSHSLLQATPGPPYHTIHLSQNLQQLLVLDFYRLDAVPPHPQRTFSCLNFPSFFVRMEQGHWSGLPEL